MIAHKHSQVPAAHGKPSSMLPAKAATGPVSRTEITTSFEPLDEICAVLIAFCALTAPGGEVAR